MLIFQINFLIKKYIVFFILATASVLYFSYLMHYYKRQLIFKFPVYFGIEKIKKQMAIIKTYPLKNNYYGSDRLILSDMQPDDQGVVHGTTKSLTLSNLKSL